MKETHTHTQVRPPSKLKQLEESQTMNHTHLDLPSFPLGAISVSLPTECKQVTHSVDFI